MGYSTGIDARGRPFKMIDGKRVNASGQKGKTKTASARVTAAPKFEIDKLMHKWFGNSKTGREVTNLMHRLLHTRFNLWFAVAGKTQVGRQGRLYAMRKFLEVLRDRTNPKEFETPNHDLDYPKFAKHLQEKHDIKAPPAPNPGAQAPPDDSAEILRIVRDAGLDAQRLAQILKKYAKSENSRT